LIGFESLDEGNLRSMRKSFNTMKGGYEHALAKLRKYRIRIYATFVFGYENDARDSFARAVDFAIEQRFYIAAFNHLTPFPGTPLYDKLKQEQRLRFDATPRGLGNSELAVESLVWAVSDMQRRNLAIDAPWGEVHRVRRGEVDVPVGGCSGALGCFRVLTFSQGAGGIRSATSGDGWVLAVEFAKGGPRAYSVLAYGQSPDPASPHHSDQAAMFARGEMKTVRFAQQDVVRSTAALYTPGQRR
jgi:acyl-homoserine lactone acylase PvdQ